MITNKSNKVYQAEKLKNSINKWRMAMNVYVAVAEREYRRISTLIQTGQSGMTDAEVKNATRMLGK